MIVRRSDGTEWRLSEPQRTSDGYVLATGTLLDPETLEPVTDEYGFPVIHSFFLGTADNKEDK